MPVNEKGLRVALDKWIQHGNKPTPHETLEMILEAYENAVEYSIQEAFNAGKEIGEIAGKVAEESLVNVRYEKEKLELAYQQLLINITAHPNPCRIRNKK